LKKLDRLASGQNATTLQVALGVISAVLWMFENPKKVFGLPDDLPHDLFWIFPNRILGNFISTHPIDSRSKTAKFISKKIPPANQLPTPWQFGEF